MKRIVVGVDGSHDSDAALRWAAAEASMRGTSLTILHVVQTPVVTTPLTAGVMLPPTDDLKEYGAQVLRAAESSVSAAHPDLPVSTELMVEQPVAALLTASRDAGLVVVGTRGMGAVGAAFLGSVSTRVSARSSCPTAVIGAGTQQRPGPVVVGVDGSPQSAAALRFALEEARHRGASLRAVHAFHIQVATLPMEYAEMADESIDRRRAAAEQRAREIIDNADVPPEVDVTLHVTPEDPADALVRASEDSALTVVGSRGRGAFRGMLLGSVSQRLLHHAHGPVIVVHADGDDAENDA